MQVVFYKSEDYLSVANALQDLLLMSYTYFLLMSWYSFNEKNTFYTIKFYFFPEQ